MKSLTQNTRTKKVTAKAVLKRKVGYTEELVSMMCARLSELDIDKDIEEINTELNRQ